MTASDRIFMRRHEAAFRQVDSGPRSRRAVIRAAVDFGIRITDAATFFRVHRKTVYSCVKNRDRLRTELELAQYAVSVARSRLRAAEGRERAALERLGL